MVRVVVLLVLGAGAFSIFVFKQGGYLQGTVLALFAVLLLVLSGWSIRRRRANAGPLSPTAKRVIAVLSIAMLAGVAYSMYWVFRVPRASTKPIEHVYSLRTLCNTPARFYPDGAAYTGAAPHPIMVFAAQDSVGLDEVHVDYPAPPQWSPQDATKVQLVACLKDVESGPFITDCKFTSATVPLYQGHYRGPVFEVRTGKKVGSVAVDGITGPKCPSAVLTKGDKPRIFSMPDLPRLVSALGDKVDR